MFRESSRDPYINFYKYTEILSSHKMEKFWSDKLGLMSAFSRLLSRLFANNHKNNKLKLFG